MLLKIPDPKDGGLVLETVHLTAEWSEVRIIYDTGAAVRGRYAGSLNLLVTGPGELFLDNFEMSTVPNAPSTT